MASSHVPSTVKVPLFPDPLGPGVWSRYLMYFCTQAWPGSAQINRPFLVWKLRSKKEMRNVLSQQTKRSPSHRPSLSPDPHQQLPPVSPLPHPTLVAVPEAPAPFPLSQPYWFLRLHPFPLWGAVFTPDPWLRALVLDNFPQERVGLPLTCRRNSRLSAGSASPRAVKMLETSP